MGPLGPGSFSLGFQRPVRAGVPRIVPELAQDPKEKEPGPIGPKPATFTAPNKTGQTSGGVGARPSPPAEIVGSPSQRWL